MKNDETLQKKFSFVEWGLLIFKNKNVGLFKRKYHIVRIFKGVEIWKIFLKKFIYLNKIINLINFNNLIKIVKIHNLNILIILSILIIYAIMDARYETKKD